jgi:hypothetical protein
MTKNCPACGTTKPAAEFNRNSRRKDGLACYCRPCAASKGRRYYTTNRGDHNARDRERHTDPARRAAHLCRAAKARAEEKGLPFDLTPEWVAERVRAGACEATGLPFDFANGGGVGHKRAFGPSLDRTDNTRGYTKDNVKVVCWIYNAAKGVSDHATVVRFAEALCKTQ